MRRKKSKRAVLRDDADKLYQIKLIGEKPRSVVSGEPTEVIHHFVPKSQSNNLRYDYENGVPLTHKEHARHHLSGDPSIVAKILKVNGQEWFDDVEAVRKEGAKFTKEWITIQLKILQDLLNELRKI